MAHSMRSWFRLAVVVVVLSPAPAGADSRPIAFRSATEFGDAIRAGELTSIDLLALYRRRIEAHNPRLGALGAHDWAAAEARARSLEDFRVALWFHEETIETDLAQLALLERAAEAVREAGARVDPGARPTFRLYRNRQVYGALFYYALWGCPLLATPFLEEQKQIKAAWERFFERFVLAPVFGVSAFAHDHSLPFEDRRLRINGGSHLYEDQIRWPALASVAELPVTVAPVGFGADGLPVGVRIIGPRMGDRTTIEFARLLGGVVGGYRIPPDFRGDTK